MSNDIRVIEIHDIGPPGTPGARAWSDLTGIPENLVYLDAETGQVPAEYLPPMGVTWPLSSPDGTVILRSCADNVGGYSQLVLAALEGAYVFIDPLDGVQILNGDGQLAAAFTASGVTFPDSTVQATAWPGSLDGLALDAATISGLIVSGLFDSSGYANYANATTNYFNTFFLNGITEEMDLGISSSPLGNVYAGAFYGDGSNLTGISGGVTWPLESADGSVSIQPTSYTGIGVPVINLVDGDGNTTNLCSTCVELSTSSSSGSILITSQYIQFPDSTQQTTAWPGSLDGLDGSGLANLPWVTWPVVSPDGQIELGTSVTGPAYLNLQAYPNHTMLPLFTQYTGNGVVFPDSSALTSAQGLFYLPSEPASVSASSITLAADLATALSTLGLVNLI